MTDFSAGPTPKEPPRWAAKTPRRGIDCLTMDAASTVPTEFYPLNISQVMGTGDDGQEVATYYTNLMINNEGEPLLPRWALEFLSQNWQDREWLSFPMGKDEAPLRVNRIGVPENNVLGILGMFDAFSSPRLLETLKAQLVPQAFEVMGEDGVSHAVVYIDKPHHTDGEMAPQAKAYMDAISEVPPEQTILHYEDEDYYLSVLRPNGLKLFKREIEESNLAHGHVGEKKLRLVMRPPVRSCCTVSFNRAPQMQR